MTKIGKLSIKKELEKVVLITHQKIKGFDQIKMFTWSDDGNLEPIRFTTAGDSELYSYSIHAVTDSIIPLMRIITGFTFQRTSIKDGKTNFERVDYIESQKPMAHN